MSRRHRRKNDKAPASSPVGVERISQALEEMRQRGEMPDTRMDARNEGIDRTDIRMLRVNPICWGIPFDEVVFAKWVKHMLGRIRIQPWDDSNFAGSTYLPDARNLIHSRFLEESKCEFLMMLDSDVLPPPGFEHVLMKHMEANPEVRMVGGWYRKKDHPYPPVVYHWDKVDENHIELWMQYREDEIGQGLAQVDGAGAGCWLMHRSVAEAIGPKPYNMNQGGEDLHLCTKVKAAGYKMWIDWDIRCAHAGVAVA